MYLRLKPFAALILLAGAVPGSAAPNLLDLVPDDANAALMIRGVADLKKKGDKLIADTGLPLDARPSEGFKQLSGFLGINQGLDEDRPVGLLLVNEKYGRKDAREIDTVLERLVLVVPFNDREKMAANFGLQAGDLRADKILKIKLAALDQTFLGVRDKHVILGLTEPAVKSVRDGKPLAKALVAERARALGTADVLFYLRIAGTVGKEWRGAVERRAKNLEDKVPGVDPAFRRQFVDALAEVQSVFLTARLDDELRLRVLGTFPKDVPDGVRKFLDRFQGGGSDLAGLPDGAAVAAQAGRGDAVQSAALLKLAFHALYEDWDLVAPLLGGLPALAEQLDPSQRLSVVGVVTELWQQLKGHRAALYRNADPTRHGQFSMVAVLDTEDAGAFLGEIKQLARFAGAAALDLSDKPEAREDVRTVKQLIRDLDDKRFTVRQSATTKLELIGEPVLPYLGAALNTKPPLEVVRRVEAIQSLIAVAVRERRKGLLAEAGRRLQPSFSYVAKAETRDGVPVDVLHIKLADQEVPVVKQLRYLFGPHWDKVRVAVRGKQVVVVWGSDGNWLSTTLQNLKEGKRGLAAAKPITSFAEGAEPGRQIEFHFSPQSIFGFLQVEDIRQAPVQVVPKMTSLALTVERDRVQLDLNLPAADLQALNKEMKRKR